MIDDDKNQADAYFKNIAKLLARNLKTWIPQETDNRSAFDYEGRKPAATIPIGWEGDSYDQSLLKYQK